MASTQPFNQSSRQPARLIAGIILSAVTAVLLLLSFHPYNQWYLAFFALVPMLVAKQWMFPPRWAGLAEATGVGGWLALYLPGMFGSSAGGQVIYIVVAVIIIIQFFSGPGLQRFHAQTGQRWFVAQGVFGWVGFEMVRSFIPPINTHAFIAQTQYTQPWMLQPLSIFGIYGLGLVLVFCNFALAQGALYLAERRWPVEGQPAFQRQATLRWLIAAGGVLAAWVILSLAILSSAPETPTTIRVAAVQHNYPIPGHQDTLESQPLRVQALSEQARAAAAQGAQLIIMPELGLGFDPQVEFTTELKALAAETQAFLLIGYGLDDPRGWRNEAVLLTPEGQFLEVYGKNHPTSPGEPAIITAGVYPVYETRIGQVATIICNDVHWTDSTRRLARNGAQLVSVPTLEIPGIALEQVAQSVLRAVENRVAVVKSDVAYAAAVIDPYGRILAQRDGSPDGEAFALAAVVPLGTGNGTVYSKLGDWTGWLSLAGLIGFMGYQSSLGRKTKAVGKQVD